MTHRFFSQDPIHNERVTLTDDQAHHLTHVMRFKVGEQVTVFDGSGWEAIAEISDSSRREVHLQILSRHEVSRELDTELSLAIALPKGDRQKFLVEKLVEVGVTRLIPLTTQRSVAQPAPKAIQRLTKNVVAACKQCERNRLMQIDAPTSLAQLVNTPEFEQSQKLIATTHGESLAIGSIEPKPSVLIAIGPEGGFSQEENELVQANGFQAIRLGPSILRVETAALTVAAILGIGKWK